MKNVPPGTKNSPSGRKNAPPGRKNASRDEKCSSMEEKSPPRAEKWPPGDVRATSWAQGRSKVGIGSHSGSTPGAPGSAPEGPRALLILTGREHIDKTNGFLTFENRARALLILRSALKKGCATNYARLTRGGRGVSADDSRLPTPRDRHIKRLQLHKGPRAEDGAVKPWANEQ